MATYLARVPTIGARSVADVLIGSGAAGNMTWSQAFATFRKPEGHGPVARERAMRRFARKGRFERRDGR